MGETTKQSATRAATKVEVAKTAKLEADKKKRRGKRALLGGPHANDPHSGDQVGRGG
jgi:hypothetical protein